MLTPRERLGKRALGIKSEFLLRELLRSCGWAILSVNFRVPAGEVDIIARKKRRIVFVEVRSGYGLGAKERIMQSISERKTHKICTCGQWFLAKHHLEGFDIQVLVVAVVWKNLTEYEVESVIID